MLPYTTFNIPEHPTHKTGSKENWLWIILDQAPDETEQELLAKIISALQADQATQVMRVIAIPGDSFSISALQASNAKLMISFGVVPSRLGMWIDIETQGMRKLEKYSFILTSSLRDLNTNAVAKKNLWSSMQRFLDKK